MPRSGRVRRNPYTPLRRGRLPFIMRITAGLLLFEGMWPIVAAPQWFEFPPAILWAALVLPPFAVAVMAAAKGFRFGAPWWKTLAMGTWLCATAAIVAKVCCGGWWMGKLPIDPHLPLRTALFLPWYENDCLLHLLILCWLAFGWRRISRTPRRPWVAKEYPQRP